MIKDLIFTHQSIFAFKIDHLVEKASKNYLPVSLRNEKTILHETFLISYMIESQIRHLLIKYKIETLSIYACHKFNPKNKMTHRIMMLETSIYSFTRQYRSSIVINTFNNNFIAIKNKIKFRILNQKEGVIAIHIYLEKYNP